VVRRRRAAAPALLEGQEDHQHPEQDLDYSGDRLGLVGFALREYRGQQHEDVSATTMPQIQPSMNPTLVAFAFGDSNIKIAAMIGIGLIAMPSARGRISPITDPISTSSIGVATEEYERLQKEHCVAGALLDAVLMPAQRWSAG
jgi:hypothetical protein